MGQHDEQLKELRNVFLREDEPGLSERMVPLKPLFQNLRQIGRDMSDSFSHEVEFFDAGDYCELDKTIADTMTDSFYHKFSNVIDKRVDFNKGRGPYERYLTLGSVKPLEHRRADEAFALIFVSDFSTKDRVIDVSRRGAGTFEADEIISQKKSSLKSWGESIRESLEL